MYTPKVSIVIPAYNAANYLSEAIDSALTQTYPNIEVIVVNDGSMDDGKTSIVASKYGGRICYFEKPNGGSSSALNKGIQEMTGEWFSWLSHDDLYYPNKVQKQVEFLERLVESGEKVENHVLFSASDSINAEGKYIRKSKYNTALIKSRNMEEMTNNCYLVAEGGSKYCFNGCSCFIHRRVFEVIGGFNENLRLLNDTDMWKRIFKANYKVHYLPDALVIGRMHAKQISVSIGFSYHNPEQDAYWKDSLEWLLSTNIPEKDRQKALYLFGCSAFRKTRDYEGKEAFRYLVSKQGKKLSLSYQKYRILIERTIWNMMKQVYRKIQL